MPDFRIHGFDAAHEAMNSNGEDVHALVLPESVAASDPNGRLGVTWPIFGRRCSNVTVQIPGAPS